MVALLIDHSGLFGAPNDDTPHRQIVRMAIFVGFGYIGMVLAMRSNKEDFSLIIPYIRFAPQNKPDNLLLLDTSVIVDGRIADLIEANFLEGLIVVPRFVLKELQQLADSNDAIKRARGRRGLEVLNRIQRNTRNEVKIHDGDFPDEKEVDAKLVRLARNLGAKLYTNDYNLGKIAELQRGQLRQPARPGQVAAHGPVAGRNGQPAHCPRGQGQRARGWVTCPTARWWWSTTASLPWGSRSRCRSRAMLQTGAGVIVFADLKQPVAV